MYLMYKEEALLHFLFEKLNINKVVHIKDQRAKYTGFHFLDSENHSTWFSYLSFIH